MIIAIHWLLSALLCLVALWTSHVAPDWRAFSAHQPLVQALFLIALVVHLLPDTLWQRLPRPGRAGTMALRLLAANLLIALLWWLIPAQLPGGGWVIGSFVIFNLTLLLLNLFFRQHNRASLVNLGISLASLLVALLLVELLAPTLTESIARVQQQAAINAARAAAASPLDAEQISAGAATPPPGGLTPQVEVIQRGGGPAWGEMTGWGTNTDTILRYWMDGVYEAQVEYNSLGFRGPEISYDKPADVYRVMLVGDSFIEAREVNYEDTVYAQLSDLLAHAHTPDGKQIEVFGVGATGWGTLQAYLYYQHEGHRFAPDLIIHVFIINDVADNHPQQFYTGRGIDFAFEGDQVRLIRDGRAPEEASSSPAQRWLDALPQGIQQTRTAALLRRLLNPPREVVTLAGNLGNAHPQNYIFVREPQIEGYPEGWRRTQRAYEIWAQAARANDAQLMVVAVDISVERITEISTYYPNEQQNWVWDVDLPYTRLREILAPLGVELVLTRQRYADYARSVGQRPFEALFYQGDGHWNPAGHRVTAELIADALAAQGIITD